MSYFARVGENNIVDNTIKAEQDFIDSFGPEEASKWRQISYNTRGNIHYGQDGLPDGGVALRGNYAGIGYHWDAEYDKFYEPQPNPSWILNKSTWLWEAPTPMPNDGKAYLWDEPTLSWVEFILPPEDNLNV